MAGRKACGTMFSPNMVNHQWRPFLNKTFGGINSRNFFHGRNWDPFSDLHTAIKDVERSTKEFERIFERMESRGRHFPFWSRRLPYHSSENTHRVALDLKGFKPEDIKVKLNDRTVTVSAKMEKASEDGAERLYKEVTKKYTLPENADLQKMKSIVTEDGYLRIEAPTIPKESEVVKEIPIKRASN